MGNLNILTPKDFTKDHHEKGYKEIGFTFAKIIYEEGHFFITKPYEYEAYNSGLTGESDTSGEYIIWIDDEPVAEFKKLQHANWFLNVLKIKNK